MTNADFPAADESHSLQGRRITLWGRFEGMTKREVARLAREQGATVSEKPHPAIDLVVVGEQGLPLVDETELGEDLDPETYAAIRSGRIELIGETQLWQRLGLVKADRDLHRLYTPAMLADLLGVPVAVVRRWHRRGLISPAREVRRLPYFDFHEVATARRLADLLAAGVSPRAIERKLESLRGLLPGVERPLAQLSVIIEGKRILLRQGDGLIEPGGQMLFAFEPDELNQLKTVLPPAAAESASPEPICSPEQLTAIAAELEEAGQLAAAAETQRAALAAGGPTPEGCFALAELLYRLGDASGARERYYMAVELDENYVEARANLGCVLAEEGRLDLAEAALTGALAYHPDYPDAHYHLADLLERLGRPDEAKDHWAAFLLLAPESPWADQAKLRLQPDSQEMSNEPDAT